MPVRAFPLNPADPPLDTLASGPGNPPVRFFDTNRHKPVYHRLRHHHHLGKARPKKKQGGRR